MRSRKGSKQKATFSCDGPEKELPPNSPHHPPTELFPNRHHGLSSKCAQTLAALASSALTSGVEALVNGKPSSSSSAHHLMHQHHHHGGAPSGSHSSPTTMEAADYGSSASSGSSLSNTVRRISLNILNTTSTVAAETLRDHSTSGGGAQQQQHPFRSASAAGAYHTGRYEERSSEATLSSSPATTASPLTSTLTTTYSYLSDLFPRLLAAKSEPEVGGGSDLPSGYLDPVDYIIDDYDTLDSLATGSPLLSENTQMLSAAATTMSPAVAVATEAAGSSSASSSSSDLFMRLMSHVLNGSGEQLETSSPDSLMSSSLESTHRSHHYHSEDSPRLFASHLLNDPVLSSATSASAVAASPSPVSSFLLPSLMSSTTGPDASGTDSGTSAHHHHHHDTETTESSRYHDFFQLFSGGGSHHHNGTGSGPLPAAFSALTSSQLVASSYAANPAVHYHAQQDDRLSANGGLVGQVAANISSILTTTSTTAASSFGAGAASSLGASSSSYYASEMSSSMSSFSTLMDDYSATVASSGSSSGGGDPLDGTMDWADILILVLKVIVLGSIILSAIFGNLLVIISVLRHHRLRITTNYFIVSLALADILVALFAMTFNASVIFTGHWIFDMWVCDFWNCCDVLFSTASIMHLSCISYDRYYAIIKPLDYPMKVTTKRVYVMIGCVWMSSVLISSIPVFTGIYTTDEAMAKRIISPDICEFVVNIPYSLISSTVSFWLPCGFMVAAYYKILKEALKQEKFIYRTQQMANANNYHNANLSDGKKSGGKNSKGGENNNVNKKGSSGDTQHLNAPRHSSASENNVIQIQSGGHRNSHAEDPESGSSTPTKRTISKMKREHKAAKTLGIIMGAFIACWFPFFIWYVVSTILAWDTPKVVVDLLFWVGYLNSAMNPIIYAYFNREFREAFKETLRNIFCCCLHLKCLEQQRTDAISFSCTYRSTTDIGLVENKYVKE